MANNAELVAVGKPKSGGAVFVAPKGTKLPTDATSTLDKAFECLGFISEDGVTQTEEVDTEEHKVWGGDIVLESQTSRSEQFQMTYVEHNETVLKQVYGEDNVTGTWASGISVKHNGIEKAEHVYVIETVLGKERVNRLVIPRGKVIEVGDVVRKDDELFGYETTIKGLVYDDEGNTAFEYFAKVGSASTGSGA